MRDMMNIHISGTRAAMGQAAAHDIAIAIRQVLKEKEALRMILAAAPSQSDMLSALRHEPEIDWQRVSVFHMDEYIGLPEQSPQRFANWLRSEFVDHLPLAGFEPIDPGPDPIAACSAYAKLLAKAPIDIVLLGIGTNGHLAFNDPPADLHDPEPVKVVTLDQMCREQQVLDGCFPSLEHVPKQAITLTVPTLMSGLQLFCCVPGRHKSAAVHATLHAPISGDCPATALRNHPSCHLYLDRESSTFDESL